MQSELTLAHAEWCRKQSSKYLKIAAGIEELLQNSIDAVPASDPAQRVMFSGNRPLPSFEQVQKEAKEGGRVKNIAARLQAPEEHVRDLLTASNSKFFIGDKGWVRPEGWVDPKSSK